MLQNTASSAIAVVLLFATIAGLAGCSQNDEQVKHNRDNQAIVPKVIDRYQSVKSAPRENDIPAIEKLIDQLVDVGSEGVGFHSTAWAAGFLAIDEAPKFRGGVLGSPKPVVSIPMRELVKLGVPALPSLIEHLSDERETHVTVATGQGIIMSQWHSDEYHPRYRERKRHPSGVNTDYELNVDSYRLKVGDLCYVAIGQIVNRSLSVVRYQPSGCRVINSPVQRPSLAAAVRTDWLGLTKAQHQETLVEDSFQKSPFSPASALKRLHFYYPEKGCEIAVKLLSRPPCDVTSVSKFVHDELLPETDAKKWRGLIDGFRNSTSSVEADSIPFHFFHEYWIQPGDSHEEKANRIQAGKILKNEFPEYDMNHPAFINSVWISDQSYLIDGISSIESDLIDKAVFEFFNTTVNTKFAWDNPIELDDLAMFCMERLIDKGHEDVFLKYCNHRIEEIEKTPSNSTQRYRLQPLREWSDRMKNH